MFEVQVIARPADLVSIEDEWQRLWMSTRPANVFTSPLWASSFFSSHRDIGTPHVMALRQDGILRAVLPLYAQNDQLTFAGAGFADYNDIVMQPAVSAEPLDTMVEALCAISRDCKRIVFPSIHEDSLLMAVCRKINRQLGMRCQLQHAHRCLSAVNEGLDFQRCYDHENARRCERRIEKIGPLAFQHLSSRDEIRAELAGFFEHHSLRRAVTTNTPGHLQSEVSQGFIRELVSSFDPATLLRFALLRVGDMTVAWHLGFELEDRYLWYLPGFNIDYWNYRPGLIIIRQVFRYAILRGLSEVDFTIGDEEYKYRYANQTTWSFRCSIERSVTRAFARRCRNDIRNRGIDSRRMPSHQAEGARVSGIVPRSSNKGPSPLVGDGIRRRDVEFHVVSLLEMSGSVRQWEPQVCNTGILTVASARLSEMVRFWLRQKGAVRPTAALELWRRNGRAFVLRSDGETIGSAWIVSPSAITGQAVPVGWIARNAEAEDMILYPHHVAGNSNSAATGAFFLNSLIDVALGLGARRLWTWSAFLDLRRRNSLTSNRFQHYAIVLALGSFGIPVRCRFIPPMTG